MYVLIYLLTITIISLSSVQANIYYNLFYIPGKIELIFAKAQPQLWTSFGLLDRRKVADLADTITSFEYDVCASRPINSDSFAVHLKPRRRVLQHVPVGYHLRIASSDSAASVERSYTPVPPACMPDDVPLEAAIVPLLVKRYAGGALSVPLTAVVVKPPADATVREPLRLSQPRGAFSLYKTRLHTRVAMLAAGSGLTPMLSVLAYMLQRTSNKMWVLANCCFGNGEFLHFPAFSGSP